MKYKIYSLICLLLFTVPSILTFLLPDRGFSDNENRMLGRKPILNAETILDGTFQTNTEEWLSDQFPQRDFWMSGSSILKKLTGSRDIGGAYLGKDGYYLEMHTPEEFDEARYRRNLGYFQRIRQEFDLPASALLIPCAASVMPEALPFGAASYDAGEACRIAGEVLQGVELPDLTAALQERTDVQRFYRTDHHWTVFGAKIGYDQWLKGSGNYIGEPYLFCSDFYGSTWSKTLDPAARPDEIFLFPVSGDLTVTADGETIDLYDLSAAERKDKYTVFFGGNHGIVSISGGCKNGKKLLVFKDSFANCFAPLLTADYETVLLIDLRYYPGSVHKLISEENPDELLFIYEMSNLASGTEFAKILR